MAWRCEGRRSGLVGCRRQPGVELLGGGVEHELVEVIGPQLLGAALEEGGLGLGEGALEAEAEQAAEAVLALCLAALLVTFLVSFLPQIGDELIGDIRELLEEVVVVLRAWV